MEMEVVKIVRENNNHTCFSVKKNYFVEGLNITTRL